MSWLASSWCAKLQGQVFTVAHAALVMQARQIMDMEYRTAAKLILRRLRFSRCAVM